jgi:hypothetical protein
MSGVCCAFGYKSVGRLPCGLKDSGKTAGWIKFHFEINWNLTPITPNVAAVALANKNARIAWALLSQDRPYQSGYATAAA